jgi:hypothetical protein
LGLFGGVFGGVFGDIFGGGGGIVGDSTPAIGYSNTVKRSSLNAAVIRIIGNPKISRPIFDYPSNASLASQLNVAYSQGIIQQLLSGVFG